MNLSIQKGYTIIEMLIVIVIIGAILGASYISFQDFSKKQKIIRVSRQIESDLRYAQEQALAGTKPQGFDCNPPDTYTGVAIYFNSFSTLVAVNCSSGDYMQLRTYSLPDNIKIIPPTPSEITFLPLGKGTSLASSVTVGICQADQGVGIEIGQTTGQITTTSFDCP
ncbi:hypothetical protein A2382_03035 [Candidatus Woesebacteria bacterium RIFOXYB1_FULL_38_16]|uniref:General secretion pathway GspH domain-containing protein n=1 Tax=Candidatus Woesebacteria bacterium RIFOXYB1_FULL_38_16 TaxID=1802538 RepID=A0A1F8CSX4_9BACT|nr:MAG: hypothetical protein A2191_00075 [Candidatus Woesebacteria bacterium RIFOXYA1_FULL_38_9]OGM79424.1 MAG: hypothetical protein A2382_03035 [Candidatus Woesebacteria bacterium RIFOXYB1_FULL_38_16]